MPEFVVASQIGETRGITPEGYLVCRNVPLARTGTQDYHELELGGQIAGNKQGIVTLHRDASEVFKPETIASFNGKPFVVRHPPGMLVSAGDWRAYAMGTVINPRQGEGEMADRMIADIIIYDTRVAKLIEDGMREVSAGYTCDYEQTGDAEGRQVNIIGNHVALVERGRCGPACAIGDEQMAVKTGLLERVKRMIKAGDENAAGELINEITGADPNERREPTIIINVPGAAGGDNTGKKAGDEEGENEGGGESPTDKILAAIGGLGTRMETLEARMTKIEEAEKAEVEAKTGDAETEEEKAARLKREEDEDAKQGIGNDAAVAAADMQAARAGAEILSPGIKLPVLDAKTTVKTVVLAARKLRLDALTAFLGDAQNAETIKHLGITAADCAALPWQAQNLAFATAVAMKGQKAAPTRSGSTYFATGDALKTYKPRTPDDINAANRAKYGYSVPGKKSAA